MFSLASTQSCMLSRMELGFSRSLSPTCIQMRRGFAGLLGISFACRSHAPPGVSELLGHCWFTNVPERVSTRWYSSGWYHAMMIAHDPPELHPIVARPSGSL